MIIRKAKKEELRTIVSLLSDDPLGKRREDPNSATMALYDRAFTTILADPNQELMVVIDDATEELIGTFQLSFIQYLTYQGGLRAQLEAVRVRNDIRGKGIGKKMMKWAIQRAQEKGAHLLQLTTDKRRPEALKFYKELGFQASHEGMKIHFS